MASGRSSTPCGSTTTGPSQSFWREDLGAEAVESGYDWATDHERTIEALESFLTSRRKRKGLADSSIDTLRYRLNRYVAAYCEENGTDDLVTPVAREGDVPAYKAVDACWAAFDRLHVDLDGGQTKRRIHLAVSNWYAHLVRRKWAAVNPADGLDDEFDWSNGDDDDTDTPCLATEHVRALYNAADDQENRLLVLALCAWGLRPNEVASLRVRQFVLDISTDEVPYITFEERKNGPGEVSLLYGKEVLEDRIAMFADHEEWDGYLFPSPHASGGPISRWTVWNRFTQLAEQAGLPDEIGGVSPRQRWGDASGMTPIPRHSTSSSEASTRLRPNKEARVPTSYCKITSQIRGPGSSVESICVTS